MISGRLKELPSRWCFTTSISNNDEFTKWYIQQDEHNATNDLSVGNHYCVDEEGIVHGYMHYAEGVKTGFVELTFEDFKRFILDPDPVLEPSTEDISYIKPILTKANIIYYE